MPITSLIRIDGEEEEDSFYCYEDIFRDLLSDNDNDEDISQIIPFTNSETLYTKQFITSTIRRQTIMSPTKLALSKAMGIDFETIPDYLSHGNQTFENKIVPILSHTIPIEELRKIAILMYKINYLKIVQSLWIVYQKSATGDLPSLLPIHVIHRKICPLEVQLYVKLSKQQTCNNEDNDPCLTFINHCLQQLDEHIENFYRQLNKTTNGLIGYTHSLAYIIDQFVQQGLLSQRLKNDHEIALVNYQYNNISLKRAFLAQNPNEYQMNIIKHLSKLKSNQEISKYKVNLLKQPLARHHVASSSSSSTFPSKFIKQTERKTMNTLIESAEQQMNENTKVFDLAMKEIWTANHTIPSEQQLTPMMRTLIDHHMANITGHIECLYKLKRLLYCNK